MIQLRADSHHHRQATWLELLFDLAFVISIAALTHHFSAHLGAHQALVYLLTFVPIWWVWNQFTWYASHFDNDDVVFRWFMLGGIFATLFLAVGATDPLVRTAQFAGSYIALHGLLWLAWLRAFRSIKQHRMYIALKLIGLSLGILFWSASLFFPEKLRLTLWTVGLLCQLILPIYALRAVRDSLPVHHHHIFERHGLFTIIVLGESLVGISHLIEHGHGAAAYLQIVAAFVMVACLWWAYFDWEFRPLQLKSPHKAFAFNYGQLLVYVSLGATAAGIAALSKSPAAAVVTMLVGAGLYLMSLALMNLLSELDEDRKRYRWRMAIGLLLMGLAGISIKSDALAVMLAAAIILLVYTGFEYRQRQRPAMDQ